jgi:predicted nucleic acid-binding protein
MIVADTNLIAYLLIPGDQTNLVQQFYLVEPEWLAPLLWRSELINVVTTYIRLGRLEKAIGIEIVRRAEQLMEGNSYLVGADDILAVAARTGCSGYDSEFISLAENLNLPLVTFDKRILQQCASVARKPWL